MKKIFIYSVICMVSAVFSSCFKLDDYGMPDVTLTGSIIDSITGMPIQTEQGSGIRMKLEQLSWSANPVSQYFWVKQDGTFNNARLFSGRYRVTPVDGPFVPLIQFDGTGDTIVNKSKNLEIKGVTKINFTVEPFLEVEWIKDPVVNPDNSVTVNIKFIRGTNNPLYQFNVTDVYLFVSTTPFVGNGNFDSRYSTQISYSGTSGNDELGQTVTISTKVLPTKRTFYVRVGARTADNVQKRYNFNEVKAVQIP